jgi:CheY-like chemotaxis protein
MNAADTTSAAPAAAGASGSAGSTILIVDDSAVAREHLRGLLAAHGYADIRTAASGAEALSLLEAGPGVDLVLMDVVMPDLDGVATCRRMKRYENLSDVPVIMVTALAETGRLAEAFEAGATDYIQKPAEELELLARVRAALALRRETQRRKEREQAVREQLRRALQAERALGVANARLTEQSIALADELERRERAEAELAHKASMEAALLVARTVAHEINNALSPVTGFAELLRLLPSVSQDPTAAAYAEAIGRSAALVAEKVLALQHAVQQEELPTHVAAGMTLVDLSAA